MRQILLYRFQVYISYSFIFLSLSPGQSHLAPLQIKCISLKRTHLGQCPSGVHLCTSFILRQVFDLFFISLHSLKLCASHYTQHGETTYFRCRHYTQYYQARIFFFHFITSLTIYVHLITISHLRQFPSVVYISLYLFIFRFFFILLHPSIIQRNHIRCAYLTSTCYFVNFRVVVSPIVLQNFHYRELI